MKCPYCSNLNSKVIDSRTTENNTTIRRRRECLECQERFTTYERYEKLLKHITRKYFLINNGSIEDLEQ